MSVLLDKINTISISFIGTLIPGMACLQPSECWSIGANDEVKPYP